MLVGKVNSQGIVIVYIADGENKGKWRKMDKNSTISAEISLGILWIIALLGLIFSRAWQLYLPLILLPIAMIIVIIAYKREYSVK